MTDLASETRLLGGGPGSLPRVNLMPPEIAEQAAFRKVQAGLGAFVVLALLGTGLLYANAAGSVSSAHRALDTSTTEQGTLQKQQAKYADVTAVYASAAAAQATLAQAMGQEVRYSKLMNDLSLTIPDNVWVTNMSFQQSAPAAGAATATNTGLGTLTISGVAFDYRDVAVWLDTLAQEKGYSAPVLTASTKALIGPKQVVNWSTTTTLTNDALSGRFTTTAGG